MLPQNLIDARRYLLHNHILYAMVVMADPIFTESIPTACTDGVDIFLNLNFIKKMPVPHLAAVLAHEGIHIIKADPDLLKRGKWLDNSPLTTRRGNISMDEWINLTMESEGFQFPPISIAHDPKFKGMSVRQVYDALPPDREDPDDGDDGDGEGGEGDGSGSPTEKDSPAAGKGGIGAADDVIPRALTPEEKADHRIKVMQAVEAAKSQGKLPGWAKQYVERLTNPRITFKDYFEPWLHDSLDKDDASYRRLNRHYLPEWFAPTILGNNFGHFVVALDASGSCWAAAPLLLSLFNTSLTQLRPVSTTLLVFDTQIQPNPVTFAPGETVESGPKIAITGGGGTSFVPIFDWVRKEKGDAIDGLIILTDLYGDFPKHVPPYPVLWVNIDTSSNKAPFGQTFTLKDPPTNE